MDRRYLQKLVICVMAALASGFSGIAARAAHMAMGFRVGEVTQNSAIVWTRITKEATRRASGARDAKKRMKKVKRYVPSEIAVDDREGAVPGAEGEVRVLCSADRSFAAALSTDWVKVSADHDYTHQFPFQGLGPAKKYYVKVEARSPGERQAVTSQTGSFVTAATEKTWQDVSFGVVTGQSYWDLDDPRGYHIYPAMRQLALEFLVPTGDTVYYDSEAPRARTVELARHHWHRMYSLPRLVEFHRNVPGYWEKDDHDTWVDDCWPTKRAEWMNPLTFKQGLGLFREQVPMGNETYRTVRWGKGLQVWMVEGRDFRSANDIPDGPGKTIWGAEQLRWLQQSILASDADFRVLISPTPIVGPDRPTKADNHANAAFTYEGNLFREWSQKHAAENFFVCCGDRHWQYMSIDPKTKLREFSCGPASDEHAGGTPGEDREYQPFHRVGGGFLSVSVTRKDDVPSIAFRHHDVQGKIVHEFEAKSSK